MILSFLKIYNLRNKKVTQIYTRKVTQIYSRETKFMTN